MFCCKTVNLLAIRMVISIGEQQMTVIRAIADQIVLQQCDAHATQVAHPMHTIVTHMTFVHIIPCARKRARACVTTRTSVDHRTSTWRCRPRADGNWCIKLGACVQQTTIGTKIVVGSLLIREFQKVRNWHSLSHTEYRNKGDLDHRANTCQQWFG
jgi:hypothetical protein